MVHLVFKRCREEFLISQKEAYAAAVANNTVHDFLDIVYARYARRFPIELSLDEDPAPEVLSAVDDDAPEPERAPLAEDLSEEELAAEEMRIEERQALIRKRKKQIAHWFSYRYMKEHNPDPRSSDPSNPFTSIIFSLTGKTSKDKPRQRSAVNCWSKSDDAALHITALVRAACINKGITTQHAVAVWNRVAREEFAKLDDAAKAFWEQKARDDHAVDVAEWRALNEGKISTTAEARQRCIEGLVRFGQPILDAMAEGTGMKVSLFVGGPEPADNGRLNIISLHSGTTNGEEPLNFGQAERAGIVEHVLPLFSKFLRRCYTPEECRARALTARKDLVALSDVDMDALGGSVDLASSPPPAPSTGAPEEPTPSSPHIPAALSAPDDAAGTEQSVGTPVPPTRATASPVGSRPVSPLGSPFRSPTRCGLTVSPVITPSSSPIVSEPAVPAASSPRPPLNTSTRVTRGATSPSTPQTSTEHTERPVPLSHAGGLEHTAANNDATEASPASDPESTASTAANNDSEQTRRVSGRKRFTRPRDDELRTPKRARVAAASPAAPVEDPAPPATSGPSTTTPTFAFAAVDHEGTLSSEAVANLRSSHKWFGNALAMFTSEAGMDEAWTKLVSAWAAFEVKYESLPAGQLPSTGRPTAIGDWIARARRSTWRPTISDSKHYAAAHVEWWTNLQPEWRTVDDWTAPPEDGDCDCLLVRGPNGMVSVIASLFFWASAFLATGKKSKKWAEVVVDTTNVLEYFLSLP